MDRQIDRQTQTHRYEDRYVDKIDRYVERDKQDSTDRYVTQHGGIDQYRNNTDRQVDTKIDRNKEIGIDIQTHSRYKQVIK